MAIGPENSYSFLFKMSVTGKRFGVEVNNEMTVDDLINSVATAMNTTKDKIRLSLDMSVKIKGHAASQENAEELDLIIREQFDSNIVRFMQIKSTGVVIEKK